VDALILLVVFALAVFVAAGAGRLGDAGWRFWQQLGTPEEEPDERLVRGLTALYNMDGHADDAQARGDASFAEMLRLAARDSTATLVADLEDGLDRWRGMLPLLSIAYATTPLGRRGLQGAALRRLLAADALIARLPRGRCGAVVSLEARMLVVRQALRRVRQVLTRLEAGGATHAQVETLKSDQARLVRAGLECHEKLLSSLNARREQLFGTRH
jgi:hypothetical protein